MRRFFDEDKLRPANDLHGDPDSMRLSLFGQGLVLSRKQGALQQILQRITHLLRVQRARNIFNPSGLAPLSDAQELPLSISAAEQRDLETVALMQRAMLKWREWRDCFGKSGRTVGARQRSSPRLCRISGVALNVACG